MAKPELGTKRIDPETGRKFYDLNKDPIVSPYTGISYPRSYFEQGASAAAEEPDDIDQKELDVEEDAAEMIALEETDDGPKGDDDLPDLDDDVDVDLGEDDTFLEEEEEEEDDVAGIIGVGDDDDET